MALVVVAEDDADIRSVVATVLGRGDHATVVAENGFAALEAVRQHRPNAVVTDIEMPMMTGIQLCRAIRDDSQLRRLPVIFLSGSLAPGDTRPNDVEATAVLSKPFLPRELLSCLDNALARGHRPDQQPTSCSNYSPAKGG